MDNFSKLNGAIPVASPSGGVWKIQKKRKTGDKKRRNGKKEEINKDEKSARDFPVDLETLIPDNNDYGYMEEEIGYGNTGKKSTVKRKIDLIN